MKKTVDYIKIFSNIFLCCLPLSNIKLELGIFIRVLLLLLFPNVVFSPLSIFLNYSQKQNTIVRLSFLKIFLPKIFVKRIKTIE